MDAPVCHRSFQVRCVKKLQRSRVPLADVMHGAVAVNHNPSGYLHWVHIRTGSPQQQAQGTLFDSLKCRINKREICV